MSDAVFVPKGALGASQYDTAIDTMLRDIAVYYERDGEWAEKYGTEYENDIFMMHPYCWCEKESCPWCGGEDRPNFIYKPTGLKIWWYKYIGRGVRLDDNGKDVDVEEIIKRCTNG